MAFCGSDINDRPYDNPVDEALASNTTQLLSTVATLLRLDGG